jgi:hypothetical protein
MTVTDRRQTRPLVREGAPQRQHSNFQTENTIWSQVPEWTWHHDILTDWPSVVTWICLWLWHQCQWIQHRHSLKDTSSSWLPTLSTASMIQPTNQTASFAALVYSKRIRQTSGRSYTSFAVSSIADPTGFNVCPSPVRALLCAASNWVLCVILEQDVFHV